MVLYYNIMQYNLRYYYNDWLMNILNNKLCFLITYYYSLCLVK